MAAPANRDRLRWARTRAGLSLDEAARRAQVTPARLQSWEDGDASPTINQLRSVAKVYRQTMASLLIPGPAPAIVDGPPPDFRGLDGDTDGVFPALIREIDRARDRRKVFLRLQPELQGALPQIPQVLSDPVEAASRFQREAAVGPGQRFLDSREALAAWIRRIEQMGVLIFQMSRIDPDSCRGISLWSEKYPVVLLNGADEPEVRQFTLLHETAHLLAHQSGICGVLTGPSIETRCNEFAGAVLIPPGELAAELGVQDPVGALPRLARSFRVSQSAIAVQLKSLGLLDETSLRRQLGIAARLSREKRERDREEARRRKSGPPHHLVKLRNLGGRYVGSVLDALDSDEISTVDAAYYLESKVPTIDRMRSELARKSLSEVESLGESELSAVSE